MKPLGFYAAHLRKHLDKECFETQPLRLGYIFFYLAAAAIAISSLIVFDLNTSSKIVIALFIGWCYGCFGFLGHELLHGIMVKNKSLQDGIAFFLLTPFFISPTFWKYWHNRMHHGHTQSLIEDPDAFPVLRVFKVSKFMKFMYPFTPGSGHKRSFFYFFFWFSVNAFVAQFYFRFRNNQYVNLNHKRVNLELAGQIALAATVFYLVGPANILYVGLIPFVVMNYYAMHYIATNHNISPLTRVNDPLANSLTVTNHPLLERLHFHFGYHVEHHIFPTMSGKFLKRAHAVLKRDFPETYQYMPVWGAIGKLYSSPRVYKNATTLVHPETGNRVSIQSLLPAMLDLAEETEVTPEKKAGVGSNLNEQRAIEATI